MDPNAKRLWIEALRSGEYNQTTGVLERIYDDDGRVANCCLGVLCRVAIKAGLDLPTLNTPLLNPKKTRTVRLGKEGIRSGYDYYSPEYSALPSEVLAWAGLNDPNPLVGSPAALSLAERNDAGATFEEIADLIEKYL